MRLLSLYQSTTVTGWSIWNNGKLKEYGTIKSDKKEKNPIERMKYMYSSIGGLICRKNPDWIALEQVQYQNNYRTYSQLSQLQGVLFSLFFERDMGFTLIEPTAWKAAFGVCGKTRAEQKASTIQRVRDVYKIDAAEDEADAIGVGLWGIQNIKPKEINTQYGKENKHKRLEVAQ